MGEIKNNDYIKYGDDIIFIRDIEEVKRYETQTYCFDTEKEKDMLKQIFNIQIITNKTKFYISYKDSITRDKYFNEIMEIIYPNMTCVLELPEGDNV